MEGKLSTASHQNDNLQPKGSLLSTKKKSMKTVEAQETKVHKKRKWRSGTVAKREIRKLLKTTHTVIPRGPFRRLVQEIAGQFNSKIMFKRKAASALQEAVEQYIYELFAKAEVARQHSKRETLGVEDINLARFMHTQVLSNQLKCLKPKE